MKLISIVIPLFNEIACVETQKEQWQSLIHEGAELIFVDGGSRDGTPQRLQALGFAVLTSPPGRAEQMNLGAAQAKGQLLLFLHADTKLPALSLAKLTQQLEEPGWSWGRFDLRIIGPSRWFPLIGTMINLRSRLTGIATGDQAIFVRSKLFWELNGFPCQPLMEDVEICKRLRAVQPPLCLKIKVETSGRRWEKYGVWPTIFLMWRLRWAYSRGVSPAVLAKKYR